MTENPRLMSALAAVIDAQMMKGAIQRLCAIFAAILRKSAHVLPAP
jgi:hypothetical protein